MRKIIKFLFGCLLVLMHGNSMAEERVKEESYLTYVNEITRDFVAEMEQETGLSCISSGGEMPHDVEKIQVVFVGYRRATLEEARILEIKGIQKLLKKINEA